MEKNVLTLEKIKQAQENLDGIIERTPTIYSDVFSGESGNEVYMKAENLQKTGAFKIRGAGHKIACLSDEDRSKGLIASSAGNHAQGVALASTLFGAPSTIVMPQTTPLIKVDSTRRFGAQVVLHGTCYDDAYEKALELQKEQDLVFVHPFNDIDVIAGQGTIALEILEDHPDTDILLVPVGGGGLISGIAYAAKQIKPDIKVYGVEPVGARAMKLSLEKNKLFELDIVNTIAEGVAVKKPGELALEIIPKYVDDILIVNDYDIMEAFLLLLERHKLIAEAAGVLPLAGLKKLSVKGKKVVSVISGGNIDVVNISAMINKGLVSRGRVCCFTVDLPDQPGELLKISELLYRTSANVVKLDHNQFKTPDRFKRVILEVTIETNGHEHLTSIMNTLVGEGYAIKKIV
ncbi:threonine ammonia-lyase [Fusibacter sp. JL216-2]|uniref:threonine ammonia-lyase n=1 Tax=Fusibacter sp. JL216-2 TaxID=3071453 RepID=UPI003D34CE60